MPQGFFEGYAEGMKPEVSLALKAMELKRNEDALTLQTRVAAQKHGLEVAKFTNELEKEQTTRTLKALAAGKENAINTGNQAAFDAFTMKEHQLLGLGNIGMNPVQNENLVPPGPPVFAMPMSKFQEQEALKKLEGINSLSPLGKLLRERASITPGDPNFEALSKAIENETGGKSKSEEQLTAMALKGDPDAIAILNAMQKRKEAIAERGRSLPQQTQFVDPDTGLPLIFDRSKGGTYRKTQVEGDAVAPRPVNPSAGEREKTAALNVIKNQLDRIKQFYDPSFVGIVSGRAGALTQLTNSKEAEFREIIADVKDSLLRARSGAQINEQEYARLAKLVPSYTDSEAQFAGKMKGFGDTLNAIITERTKAQKAGGVKIRNTEGQPNKPKFTIEKVE